jgi:hypothetical protein
MNRKQTQTYQMLNESRCFWDGQRELVSQKLRSRHGP